MALLLLSLSIMRLLCRQTGRASPGTGRLGVRGKGSALLHRRLHGFAVIDRSDGLHAHWGKQGRNFATRNAGWLRCGKLLSKHQEKSLSWFRLRELQLPKAGNQRGTANVLTETDLVLAEATPLAVVAAPQDKFITPRVSDAVADRAPPPWRCTLQLFGE